MDCNSKGMQGYENQASCGKVMVHFGEGFLKRRITSFRNGVNMPAMLRAIKPLSASKRMKKVNGLIKLRLKAKIDMTKAKAMITAKKANSFFKTIT